MRPTDNWHLDPRRAPTLAEDDTLLVDEPGRIMRNTDFRSHWFRLVKPRYGNYTLLVHHGGGEERVAIDYSPQLCDALLPLSSDDRYYLLHTLLKLHHASRDAGVEQTTQRYRKAFAEGRLKKRKLPGRDAVKIWIEPVTS